MDGSDLAPHGRPAHAVARDAAHADHAARARRDARHGEPRAACGEHEPAAVGEPDGDLVTRRAARAAPPQDERPPAPCDGQRAYATGPLSARGAVARDLQLLANLAVLFDDGHDRAPLGRALPGTNRSRPAAPLAVPIMVPPDGPRSRNDTVWPGRASTW